LKNLEITHCNYNIKDEDGDLVKMVSQGDLNLALKISTVKIDLYLV